MLFILKNKLKIMLLVRDVMKKNVVTAKPNITVREISNVMSSLDINSLVIVDNNKLVGIVTDSDVLRAIAEGGNPDKILASDIMSKKVITIESKKNIEDAITLMAEKKIKKLPVVDGKKLVGIVTYSDILAAEKKIVESISKLMSKLFSEKKAGD